MPPCMSRMLDKPYATRIPLAEPWPLPVPSLPPLPATAQTPIHLAPEHLARATSSLPNTNPPGPPPATQTAPSTVSTHPATGHSPPQTTQLTPTNPLGPPPATTPTASVPTLARRFDVPLSATRLSHLSQQPSCTQPQNQQRLTSARTALHPVNHLPIVYILDHPYPAAPTCNHWYLPSLPTFPLPRLYMPRQCRLLQP